MPSLGQIFRTTTGQTLQKQLSGLVHSVDVNALDGWLKETTGTQGVRQWEPQPALIDKLLQPYRQEGMSLFRLDGFGKHLSGQEKETLNEGLADLNQALSIQLGKQSGIEVDPQEFDLKLLNGLNTVHHFHQDSVVANEPNSLVRRINYKLLNLGYLLPTDIDGFHPAYAIPKRNIGKQASLPDYQARWPADIFTFKSPSDSFKAVWLQDQQWLHGVTEGKRLSDQAARPIVSVVRTDVEMLTK